MIYLPFTLVEIREANGMYNKMIQDSKIVLHEKSENYSIGT